MSTLKAPESLYLNDVHSCLNRTRVAEVVSIDSAEQMKRLLERARMEGRSLVPGGGRGAMGGQQLCDDAIVFDMRGYRHVSRFDRVKGLITVGAGMNWTELYEWLDRRQRTLGWTFRQKQTGADFLTIGGAVSANAHGRGLGMPPFVGDVEALKVMTPDGRFLDVSRQQNADLFRLVCGGYGMFGVILEVTLRLKRRSVVERTVLEISIDDLMSGFEQRLAEGYVYGDFQFQIDPCAEGFLRRGVFSCYRPVEDRELPLDRKFLTPAEWNGLLLLAHTNKSEAYVRYLDHYQQSDGQLYYCDEQQMSYYLNYYHDEIDRHLGCRGSEMITELYVPRERLVGFVEKVRQQLRRDEADVIYGTIRLISADHETEMPWAKQDYACLILNLHINHDDAGLQKNERIFTTLIDLALAEGGSFYLTYHRWVRADQLRTAYPQIDEVFAEKERRDPFQLLSSNWYRDLRQKLQ